MPRMFGILKLSSDEADALWPNDSVDSDSGELNAAGAKDEFPFVAIVTYGGVPSKFPVGGTETIEGGPYSVVIPSDFLAKIIANLEGKPIFAAESLDTHTKSTRIGQVIHAWTEDTGEEGEFGDIVVAKASGVLYRASRPKLVDSIIGEARKQNMGISYDLKNVEYSLETAKGSQQKVVVLKDFTWRGATALKRGAAAYERTALAAQRREQEVDEKTLKELLTAEFKSFATQLNTDVLAPFKTEVTASISKIQTDLDGLKGKHEKLEAKMAPGQTGQATGTTSNPNPAAAQATAVAASAQTTTQAAAGQRIGIADLVSEIGKAMAEANKPVIELLTKLQPAESKKLEAKNVRKSAGAANLALISKYKEGQVDNASAANVALNAVLNAEGEGAGDDEDEVTVDQLQAAIEKVQASKTLTVDQKAKQLGILGAAKRRLIREERVAG